MAGRAATALAVGWMGLCGGLALATIDGGIDSGQIANWLSFDWAGRSSVHIQDVERPLCADTAEERRADREGGGGTGHSPAGLLDLIDGAESAGDGADRGDQLIGAVFARLKGLAERLQGPCVRFGSFRLPAPATR